MVYGKLVMILYQYTSKKYPYIFISHIRTITRVSIRPRTFVLGTRVLGLGVDLGPAIRHTVPG